MLTTSKQNALAEPVFRLGEKESKQILKAHKRIQDGLIDLHETLHATVPLRKQAQRLHEI
jgi:hypothetical protein